MARFYAVVGSFYPSGLLDNLIKQLRSASLPELNVLVLEQNGSDRRPAGFVRVYNRLLTAAFSDPECQAVAILNDDIVPLATAVEATLSYVIKNPDVGTAFPVEVWDEDGDMVTIEPFTGRRLTFDEARAENHMPIEQIFAGFALAAISRAAWAAAGPLDEHLFSYCEDLIFGLRCWQAGFRVVNIRNQFFVHKRGTTHNRLVQGGQMTTDDPYKSAGYAKSLYPFLWTESGEATMQRLRGWYEAARAR